MEDSEQLQRVDRRVALKWISAASLSMPFSQESISGAENSAGAADPSGKGYGRDPDLIKSYSPGDLWPLTLSDDQRKLMVVLCDIILPADEESPSASSLGVHDFIDEWISSPYQDQAGDRRLILKGLAHLDEDAKKRNTDSFVKLDSGSQIEICREMAIIAKQDRKTFPGSFFLRLRDLVAGGYYTTPSGMQAIGYRGNVAMAEWNGPPPEVLEKVGVKPQE